MRFWDSSALVTLHVDQADTSRVRAMYESDPDVPAALQLASALAAVHDVPEGQDFVCLDERLSAAAARERPHCHSRTAALAVAPSERAHAGERQE